MRVPTFRELWLPYNKAANDWIRRHTNWRCFKHSCGSVVTLIPSFIDACFDIINPVECSAAGMEAAALKREYGGQIAFWGGGIDTRQVLPFRSPADVREHVREQCWVFGGDGGFVFYSIHTIKAKTPVENFVEMLDAVREFNGVAAHA